MINNYNSVLLNVWEANMDLPPCRTVTAVTYYIGKFASKCKPNYCGNVLREAVQKAKRQSNDVWKQLFAISMAILGQRLVSAPEPAYRLCHLPIKMCTRKTVFVNSCRPEQRHRLLRFIEDETFVFNNVFHRHQQRKVKQFAHAEQVIQQALIQAVALNTVKHDDNSTEDNEKIYAEDPINAYNYDDFIENNGPSARPDEVFTTGIRILNVQQKDLLKQVADTIERDIRLNDNLQPLLLFITGGAGIGKSFLLKLIVEHIRRCYAPTVDIMFCTTSK
ncbi:unnamed protein product [Parnassius apollo]|uniref:(apollo) hypothetical protein n=1 Tax=Parnassius apollo TaxID=110799 RepID=A0A8S3XQ54_PARAO|nr:unnamed protein product [Parnassius apollo]